MNNQHYTTTIPPAAASILQNLTHHAPNSAQLVGLAALVISGAILLLLSGLTLTAAALGLIFFAPLVILSSPVWVPAGFLVFVAASALLSFLGFGAAAVAAGSWIYRYFRGLRPPGSDRFDYARTRIANTAGHVKDYAWEYGGYLQSKVKDAAPSA